MVVALVFVSVGVALARPPFATAQSAQPADAGVAEAPVRVAPEAAVPAEARQAEAGRLYDLGNKYFLERDYTEAITQYQAAVALWDHPAIRFNMAECYISLVQPLLAYQNLELALAAGPDALESPSHYERGRQLEQRLLAQLGRLIVSSPDPRVQASLDGKPLELVGGTGEVVVLAGAHHLVSSRSGFVTSTLSIVLSPGETRSVQIALTPIPPPLVTRRRWPTWVPWLVNGVGAGLVLLGVPAMAAASSDYQAYDEAITRLCAPPDGCDRAALGDETLNLRERGDTEKGVAYVLWSVGGAALVTGVVMLILNEPRAVAERGILPIGASVSPDGASITATWEF